MLPFSFLFTTSFSFGHFFVTFTPMCIVHIEWNAIASGGSGGFVKSRWHWWWHRHHHCHQSSSVNYGMSAVEFVGTISDCVIPFRAKKRKWLQIGFHSSQTMFAKLCTSPFLLFSVFFLQFSTFEYAILFFLLNKINFLSYRNRYANFRRGTKKKFNTNKYYLKWDEKEKKKQKPVKLGKV